MRILIDSLFCTIIFIVWLYKVLTGRLEKDDQYEKRKEIIVEICSLLVMVSFMFFVIVFFISGSVIASRREFKIDNGNKYILYVETPADYHTDDYYGIDFNKEETILMSHNEKEKDSYIGRVEVKDYSKVKNIIEKTIRNRENRSYNPDRDSIKRYRIDTYDGRVYYIKNRTDYEEMHELLYYVDTTNDFNRIESYHFVFIFAIAPILLMVYVTVSIYNKKLEQ